MARLIRPETLRFSIRKRALSVVALVVVLPLVLVWASDVVKSAPPFVVMANVTGGGSWLSAEERREFWRMARGQDSA